MLDSLSREFMWISPVIKSLRSHAVFWAMSFFLSEYLDKKIKRIKLGKMSMGDMNKE
jgi:hypothetical protein